MKSLGGLIKKGAFILTVGVLDLIEDSIKLVTGQGLGLKHSHAETKTFYHVLRSQNNAQENPLSIDELAADCLRAISTLAYTIVNGTAHALNQMITDSPKKVGEISQLHPSSQRPFKNSGQSDSNDYLRYALESVRITHWNPALRGMIVQPENQDKRYSTVSPRNWKVTLH